MHQGVTLFPKSTISSVSMYIINFPRNTLSFSKADFNFDGCHTLTILHIGLTGEMSSQPQSSKPPIFSGAKRVAGSGIQMSETCLQLGCGNLGWGPAPNKQPPPSHRFDTFSPPPKWVPFSDQIGQLSDILVELLRRWIFGPRRSTFVLFHPSLVHLSHEKPSYKGIRDKKNHSNDPIIY